jgi:hypothetical protein
MDGKNVKITEYLVGMKNAVLSTDDFYWLSVAFVS